MVKWITITALVLIACAPPCGESQLKEMASECLRTTLPKTADAVISWSRIEPDNGAHMVLGTTTATDADGSRRDRRTFVRIWCDNKGPASITGIFVSDLFDTAYKDVRDTSWCRMIVEDSLRREREIREAVEGYRRGKAYSDSINHIFQRQLDSMNRLSK